MIKGQCPLDLNKISLLRCKVVFLLPTSILVNVPRILWYPKKKKKKKKWVPYVCHDEIGLCDHNIDTILFLKVDMSEKVCVIVRRQGNK